MNRRDFLKNSAMLAAVQALPFTVEAKGRIPDAPAETTGTGKIIDSEPMLQNYAEESIGVAFSVTGNANGFVIYGRQPDLKDGRKVYCGGFRVTDMNSDVMLVRLTGLEPSTIYYYRIGADSISYVDGYNMKVVATEESQKIYSFRTAGPGTESHFCVINDTHSHWDTMTKLTARIAEIAPSCVVWNGDTCDRLETIDEQKKVLLKPDMPMQDYASRIPYLFVPGNHDLRGLANRHLERVWMFRQPEERLGRDWDLGRNFAIRIGDVAMVGLDTGEDKQDTHPAFANLFNSSAYRVAQQAWLADALNREDIASAPFLVAFCHIPLYDADPAANPGDIKPDDTDSRYHYNYAAWQRTCSQLWTPLLQKAKCQLVVTAHQHAYRFDKPSEGRSWAQVVGGGPEGTNASAGDFATLMDCNVDRGILHLRVYNIVSGQLIDEHQFAPRQ